MNKRAASALAAMIFLCSLNSSALAGGHHASQSGGSSHHKETTHHQEPNRNASVTPPPSTHHSEPDHTAPATHHEEPAPSDSSVHHDEPDHSAAHHLTFTHHGQDVYYPCYSGPDCTGVYAPIGDCASQGSHTITGLWRESLHDMEYVYAEITGDGSARRVYMAAAAFAEADALPLRQFSAVPAHLYLACDTHYGPSADYACVPGCALLPGDPLAVLCEDGEFSLCEMECQGQSVRAYIPTYCINFAANTRPAS